MSHNQLRANLALTASLAGALRSIGVTLAVVFIGLPGAYYSYVELRRHAEIRRRRQRWNSKVEERTRRRIIEETASRDALEGKGIKQQDYKAGAGVDEEEMAEIRLAYGSFVVGGRFSNAIGSEWREQGGECDHIHLSLFLKSHASVRLLRLRRGRSVTISLHSSLAQHGNGSSGSSSINP